MAGPNQNTEDRDPQAPSSLVEALEGLHRERVFIPPSIDTAVLARVRPQMVQIRQQRARRQTTVKWLALAATIVLAGAVVQLLFSPFGGHRPFAQGDLNHDGQVDILDAFQLARELRQGGVLPQADFNHDGKTDGGDVELLAQQAVGVGKGGRL
jgi:hypothetical protein